MTSASRRARLGRRTDFLGVDVGAALDLVGTVLRYLSLSFLFPAALAIGYDESVWPFLVAAAITVVVGRALELVQPGEAAVGAREGFLVVVLTWLLVPALGALPYLLSGEDQLARPIDAYFEAMSGFSTTSSSVVTDVEALDRSIAMWRQFTVWLGGIGILVLALAVLPRLRVGGRQFFEVEMPGPEQDLTSTIRDSVRRFIVLYFGITLTMIVVLTAVGWSGLDQRMNLYEAVAHTFTTMGTGGFSTKAASVGAFGATTQWVIAFFLIVAGTNYALMFFALARRRPQAFGRDEEFRLYLAVIAIAAVVILIELVRADIAAGEAAVRHAVFQSASIITTTGFATDDFNRWPELAAVTILALMFFGPSAGSTGGSIKVVRHLLIGRILRRNLVLTVHPELVTPIRLNGIRVDERTLSSVIVFVLLYIGCFALGTFLLVADAARSGLELRVFDAIAAAATTLGNCGPGFGFAGPLGSFEPFSDVSTVLMTLLMFLGRLEIIPVAVLLTRSYWRA